MVQGGSPAVAAAGDYRRGMDGRGVLRRLAPGPGMATDALLALLFFAVEVWQVLAFTSPVLSSEMAERFGPVTPLDVGLLVLAHLPLLWRQRFPLAVLALTALAFFVGSFALGLPMAGWGMLAALYEFAARADRRSSLLALAVLVISFLVGLVLQPDEGRTAYDILTGSFYLTLVSVTPWGLGYWAQRRRRGAQGLEQERAESARRAVAAERTRVARELHDILAHSVSVMVVQAAGAREILPAGTDRVAEALAQIETTGRQSLVEVRRLLGMLRGAEGTPDLAPPPGLGDIDELVAQVRDAGLTVHVTVAGERRPLDASVDLSAYRIVQEALTNVLKHAGPATVQVTLDFREPGTLHLEVADDGRGPVATPRAGNGLLGMRERALLVGGGLEAGPREGGGFRVAATLPAALAPART